MYTVELIPKQSVLDDVVELWERTGRKAGTEKGAFYFEECSDCYVQAGAIHIEYGSDRRYLYNMADFYRCKIKRVEAGE